MNNIENGIFDAKKQLGLGKSMVMGLQHVFAMFGATVLVPILTGLSIQVTLVFAGIGTLLFHLVTKGKVPAFLGSSFAFLTGFAIIAPLGADGASNAQMLPYACGGVVVAGLIYIIVSGFISVFGIKRVMKLFPPVVTGPIIILIGLILAPVAVGNIMATEWWIGVLTIVLITAFAIFGRGMIKIIPILLGIIVTYIIAVIFGKVDFIGIAERSVVGIPPFVLAKFSWTAILTMLPIAIVTIIEHIGDISAIGATCGKNYIANPGINRTLLGDGLATSLAGMFGGPANTTYGENTGVLALSKIFDPFVIRIAAVIAIILGFSPFLDSVVHTIPTGIIGGASFVLYGMISAIGVRNMVESQVDLTKSRNLMVASVIFVSGLGINSVGGLTIGSIVFSGLACAAIFGIVLNAVLPEKDFEFSMDDDQ